jgi:tRNA nucleotidyltransferase/poly(A) polymerase
MMPLDTHKHTLISEAVSQLQYFSRIYGISSLFISGGFCREFYFGRLWAVNDIDVASAYPEQSLHLGGLFASEILQTTPEYYHRTGTVAVEYKSEFGSIRIEFQGYSTNGYMNNSEIKEWMHSQNIEDVPLMNNLYGRDFTINSLIYSLPEGELRDPTEQASVDIERKVIRSLLPADLLVKNNPLSILRAIRFALTYDFYIDKELKYAMKQGVDLLPKQLSQERILKEIAKILRTKAQEGLEMLKKFSLDKYLLSPEIKEYLNMYAA